MVEKLRERGASHIFIPRRQDYDLVQREAALALLHDARPDLIIHLAVRVRRIWVRLLAAADCAVVTNHACYDWAAIWQRAGIIVDTRHVTTSISTNWKVVTRTCCRWHPISKRPVTSCGKHRRCSSG